MTTGSFRILLMSVLAWGCPGVPWEEGTVWQSSGLTRSDGGSARSGAGGSRGASADAGNSAAAGNGGGMMMGDGMMGGGMMMGGSSGGDAGGPGSPSADGGIIAPDGGPDAGSPGNRPVDGGITAPDGGPDTGNVGNLPIDGGIAMPDGSGASPVMQVGDSCEASSPCPAGGSGTARCLVDWPGGYCAVVDCEQHGHDCPNDPGLGGTATTGGKCVLAPTAMCLALCASSSDCRTGYTCAIRTDAAGHGDVKVCVPQ